jgi:hypothetical protein
MPTGGEREGGERVGGKGRRSDDWWMGTAQCRKERKRERGRERERMRMVAGGKERQEEIRRKLKGYQGGRLLLPVALPLHRKG